MNASRSIAWNTIVQLGGKVLTLLFGLFILKLITQQLGTELTGQYLTALTYAQLFTTITELGLYAYLVRDLNQRNKDEEKSLLGQIFALRFTSGVAFLAIAAAILPFLPYSTSFQWVIGLAIVSGFFLLVNTFSVAVFQAKLRMDLSVITDVVTRGLTFLAIFMILPHTQSLVSVMTIAIIAAAATFLLNLVFLRKVLAVGITWQNKNWNTILRQTVPIWITAMLALIYFKVDSLMLSFLPLPDGKNNFVEVGYYGTVYKYLEILITFPSIFLGSLFPIMSQFALKDTPRFRTYLQLAFDLLSVLSVPIMVGSFILAPQIIVFLSSPEFLPGTPALQILIFAFLFSGFGGIFTYAILSLNQQKRLVLPYAIATVLNIVINFFAIRYYSFIGAAITTVLTEFLIAAMAYKIVSKEIDYVPHVGKFLLSIVAATVMGLALYWIRDWSLFATLPIGAGVYGVVLYLIGGVDKELLKTLRPKKEAE